jgi:8-oxo-dGTP pyrophosphatase MutT (NUDIX family)
MNGSRGRAAGAQPRGNQMPSVPFRMSPPMTSLADIRRLLANRQPCLLPTGSLRHAAVALILRSGEAGPEILFIERSRQENDPWSGDLGFPGGKVEADDGEPQMAAQRETFEEIGLDLREAHYLGRLDDIAGAHLPVAVSCFVYETKQPAALTLSAEIADVFWAPLQLLSDPDRHRLMTVFFRGERLQRPAIDLRGPEGTVLWGITYRLICQFLQILGIDIAIAGENKRQRTPG